MKIMGFYEELTKVANNVAVTENGAIAYRTSGSALVDMNFEVSAFRNNVTAGVDMFRKAYAENPKLVVLYLFYLRDCRGGLGERNTFRNCFAWLANNHVNMAKAVLSLISEYGRWDDLVALVDTKVKKDALAIISAQLKADIDNMKSGKSISLLAKWMPSINTSSNKTRALARVICREFMNMPYSEYRKTLAKLRAYTNVVETKISANKWDEVDYNTVPSMANLKYKNAFLKHDTDRRTAYLEALVKGDPNAKINASTLTCVDIVDRYSNGYSYWGNEVKSLDVTLEELWKALPSFDVADTVVVRDGSGSMSGVPITVATALAVYTAQHNKGEFKDKYITFSAEPRVIDISKCTTLRDALIRSYKEDDISNTNLKRVFRLILDTARMNKYKNEDLPKNILVISDMQFDAGCMAMPLMSEIELEYRQYGYDLPKLIFWNVAGSVNRTIPVTVNKNGVILISGYTQSLLKMVMSNETDPYKALVAILATERYKAVADALDLV